VPFCAGKHTCANDSTPCNRRGKLCLCMTDVRTDKPVCIEDGSSFHAASCMDCEEEGLACVYCDALLCSTPCTNPK
jgi:hypothetical protein